jgi:hypothetical protein
VPNGIAFYQLRRKRGQGCDSHSDDKGITRIEMTRYSVECHDITRSDSSAMVGGSQKPCGFIRAFQERFQQIE